jgi:phosphoglycolate phosphatase
MLKLLLFDIDGTLVMTGGAGVRAMNRAFEDTFRIKDAFRGVSMPGRTDKIILSDALQNLGCTLRDEEFRRFRSRYCEVLREEMEEPGPRKGVLPGVRPLLDALSSRDDMFVALLTGNFGDAARIKLEYFGLWQYFACGAFGDDSANRNDLVAIAAERARSCGAPAVAQSDVIVIGDTPLDVACANAAGARSVAVATGFHDIEELRGTGADLVLPDLSEIDRFVRFVESESL